MQYFKVYSTDNIRYVRDLTARLMMDEQMTTKHEGEAEFVIAVYTKEEFDKVEKVK
jgi:hypothetical protein